MEIKQLEVVFLKTVPQAPAGKSFSGEQTLTTQSWQRWHLRGDEGVTSLDVGLPFRTPGSLGPCSCVLGEGRCVRRPGGAITLARCYPARAALWIFRSILAAEDWDASPKNPAFVEKPQLWFT